MRTTYAEVAIRAISNGRQVFTGNFPVDNGGNECVVAVFEMIEIYVF